MHFKAVFIILFTLWFSRFSFNVSEPYANELRVGISSLFRRTQLRCLLCQTEKDKNNSLEWHTVKPRFLKTLLKMITLLHNRLYCYRISWIFAQLPSKTTLSPFRPHIFVMTLLITLGLGKRNDGV